MAEGRKKTFLTIATIVRSDLFALSVLYFFIRLVFLTSIPVFNDEAIHLNWGWIELHIPGQAFHSLNVGKPPLLLWLIGIFETVLPDPLIAGRLVLVLVGFASLLGIYFLSKKIFNHKVAKLAALLYIVSPMFTFFDRQVLMDSAISAAGIWSCYLLIRVLKDDRRMHAFLLGFVLGIGYFIKPNTIIFIATYLSIYAIAFIWKKERGELFKNLLFSIFAFLATDFMLFIQPFYWELSASLAVERSLTMQELFQLPFPTWIQNAKDALELGFWHLTPLVFVLGLLGIAGIFRSSQTEKKVIACWFLVSMVLVILVARALTPRYIVSYLPLMMIFCVSAIVSVWEKRKYIGFFLATFGIGISLGITGLLLRYPLDYFSALAQVTKFSQQVEYVTQWPSGYGVEEAKNLLEDRGKEERIYVVLARNWGNPDDAMFAYFNSSQTVRPSYLHGSVLRQSREHPYCFDSDRPIYFVSRGSNLAYLKEYIEEEVKIIYKPGRKDYVGVYRLRINCASAS